MNASPYYADEHVTLYHGDCLELADLWTCGAYSSPRVRSAQPGPAWKGRQGVRRLPVLAGPALTRGAR